MLAVPGIHANLIPDAHLAVLAIQHGLTVCSTDSDFARLAHVRWSNPLSPELCLGDETIQYQPRRE